ncbi:hypothetical protein [Shewanella waksmanii]|uniref:hypothetical protein n=1 Tax=Shewanella waksmanii TaxID=213783 RepID=UPI0004AE8A60|nr:hypothetical protein [Shewanella waksmanii]
MSQFIKIDSRWCADFGNDLSASRDIAACCHYFDADDEDEQVDDVAISCVNCAFRRWLAQGVECMKLPPS